ncbi:hypothetical protein BsWGS_03807 [Bradybaena similaris]
MTSMMQITGSVLAGLLLTLLPPVEGHARLWDPPGRSTMWRRGFQTPVNFQDNELFCGGLWHQIELGYKCGLCGDPYDGTRHNEAGGKYANGIITRTYRQGQRVTMQVDVTANHKGFFEFKICPTNDPKKQETQECFDRYPLSLLDGSSYRYYIPTTAALMSVDLLLPQNLTCEFCVLQFRYHTGNSWGTDPDGTSCVSCGHQEEFYGCSDIRILPHGSSESAIEEETPTVKVATNTVEPSQTPKDREAVDQRYTLNHDNASVDNSWHNNGTAAATPAHGGNNIQGDNIVCRGVRNDPAHDEWCQLNCQLGYCPESHCKCVELQYPHSNERKVGCRAAGGFAKVQGCDKWCQDNCKRGHCPSSMCVC